VANANPILKLPAEAPHLLGSLKEHLQRIVLDRQQADGHWHYSLDDNVTMNAEYIFFLRWMEEDDRNLINPLAQFLLNNQLPDGSWNLYFGGSGNLNASIESYLALRLAGYSADHPNLVKAKDFILAHGGIPKARVFTKIWLALFDLYSWEGIPIIPPEIMLSPRGTPFNIYEFSYWSRTVIIPLLILFHFKKMLRLNFTIDELYLKPEDKNDLSFPEALPVDQSWFIKKKIWDWKWINWENVFGTLTQGATLYENVMPIKPLRAQALAKAKKWILKRQEKSGDWGGIVPAMMNSVMALYAMGDNKSSEPILKGLKALERLTRGKSPTIKPHDEEIKNANSATLQSCVSPVWDTGLAALALLECGMNPQSHEMQQARQWLWENRVTHRSDWAYKAKLKPNEPIAAWCFQYHNSNYPDLDDSAVVTLVLHRTGMSLDELKPALNWIFGMQNSDGGWGTFDRDNDQWILNEIPFADLKSLIDPSNPDVTGHVLETLGELGYGKTKAAQRAVRYLKRVQRDNGSWFGRWGVHTLYGTCAAVVGLRKVGEPVEAPYLQRAIHFVVNSQNADGGWGENCDCYRPHVETAVGVSTASQTAWALMALQACRQSSEDFAESIHRGLEFLKTKVSYDGLEEKEFTGTGFPMHFYLRYDGYRNYFPLIALGRLQHSLRM